MNMRRRPVGRKYAARCTARNWHNDAHVGVRLQQQRHALNRRRIGGFAAFGQRALNQRLRIGQLREVQTRRALAAEIVDQPFAARCLREHSRQRVFPHAARPGEKQRVRHTARREHASQRRDDPLIADVFVESQNFVSRRERRVAPIARPTRRRSSRSRRHGRQVRLNRGQHVDVN
jgi:hypothetical protein